MASFRVEKAYFVPHRDLVVLAGRMESGKVERGGGIDLPRELKGPGWVPIFDVQVIPFKDGSTRLTVVLEYEALTGAPMMEFSALEGLSLQVRGP